MVTLFKCLLGYQTDISAIVTGLAFTAAFEALGQTCPGHLAEVCGAPAFVTMPNILIRSAKTVIMTAYGSLEHFGKTECGRFKHAVGTVTLLASTFPLC